MEVEGQGFPMVQKSGRTEARKPLLQRAEVKDPGPEISDENPKYEKMRAHTVPTGFGGKGPRSDEDGRDHPSPLEGGIPIKCITGALQ